jgi:glucose-6-phosphate-specific signal transduction histidine kinase
MAALFLLKNPDDLDEVFKLDRALGKDALDFDVPAERTRVDIDLLLETDKVGLEVVDNGVGISETDMSGKKSLGLLGMHERALLFGGDVKITGTPSHGTRVSVSIPLKGRT